jgi:DNA-binding HxlR family transcriptional regulator
MNCSIARSLEVIGEWWTLLIVRDAFFGVTRFEALQERLGISRGILAARLQTLVDHGVLERRCYDAARQRYDYVLTAKGRALWPVVVTIRQWGDEWIAGTGNESVAVLHRGCGGHVHGVLTCSRCGEHAALRECEVAPGPGLTDAHLIPAHRA